ncbi:MULTISPECIES: AAA family ATPase [unclassified Bosea (in: a-proteobacteria)]|uniref:AAA family ATPase n=1 Tax=unclassified Bosea (in: a-proteobacteria) TaxID=2653178 RepID=UPI00125F54A7|nr:MULTISPECIES: AAA family ATPase [unclassified Bosea (in: a-proteobacteria)]CAD5298449.1 AAA ATPase [Bosea sp. 7B]VXB35999.1 AAA ATPase [Bosea sp. 127]VXB57864.1 AAA ATPase [Bosea sp. 125]
MPEQIPANVDVGVLIGGAHAVATARLAGNPGIILSPEKDERTLSWNDFGLNFCATLFVINGDLLIQIPARFMMEGIDRTSPELERLLVEHGGTLTLEKLNRSFVSLLPDEDAYSHVIRALGFEAGISALRRLGDIVVARIEGSNQASLTLADTESFHFGVLRAVNGYTALRRSARHFRRSPPAPVEDLTGSFSFETSLPAADNPYQIDFAFDGNPLFQDRVAVLIGRNGVGKTQLLKALVDRLTRDEAFDPSSVSSKLTPEIMPRRVLVFSAVPTDPFPSSIGAWHGIDYEYFAINATREEGADSLLTSLMACVRDEGPDRFGPQDEESRASLVRSVLKKLNVWQSLYVPLRPLQAEQEDLRASIIVDGQRLFPIKQRLNEQAGLRLLHQLDWTRSPIILDELHSPKALSSGEYAMMRFAVQAIASVEQGSLLLIDEPETHLHPNFVSDLMEVLYGILEATGSVAIIATHSAYVVREAPRQRVKVLTLQDRQIQIVEPRMQTFGASIDKISQFVFGDTDMEHRYQKKLEEWTDRVGRDLGIEKIIRDYGAELNPESLSFIAGHLRAQRPSE